MMEAELHNYINKQCYEYCRFKKENMGVCELRLPNGVVNNIIDYALGKEAECEDCQEWRANQELIKCHLNIAGFCERNVEDDVVFFLIVCERQFLRISKRKNEITLS